MFLKNHSDIKFIPADKGNVTVALNKDDYYNTINILLNDEETYKIIENNLLPSLRKNTYDLLVSWNESGYLNRKYRN